MPEKIKAMCQSAVRHWGMEAQAVILIEECSELTKEVCKVLRGRGRLPELKEELADVLVMCEQAKVMFGISDLELEELMYKKMERTIMRMNEERDHDKHDGQ